MSDTFAEFVGEHTAALHRFAYVLCGNRHLAEDLVQEALARTHRHWRRIAPASRSAYLRTAIVRGHLSWRRRRSSTEQPWALTPEPPPSGDIATRHAVRDELWSLLATLPRAQRAVLVLRFYEDLDDARIAEVLGCAQSTVRVHAFRALAGLRTRLDPALATSQGD